MYEFNQKMRIRSSDEELRDNIEKEEFRAWIELIYKFDISLIREYARIKGISGYSEMSKGELIYQLMESENIFQPMPESVRHLR